MACHIAITSYVGLTPPATPTVPSIIRVSGTARECPGDEVCVRVRCAQPASEYCIRVVNERWTVDVPTAGLGCECGPAGQTVSIEAWCNAMPTCYVETSGHLFCQSLCPQVTAINPPVVPPCVPGPAPPMDVTLTAVYSGSVWGATFDWDYGDGTSEKNVGPAPTHKYSFPGNYSPTVTLNPNTPGCSPSSATININVPLCTTTTTTTPAPGQTTTTTTPTTTTTQPPPTTTTTTTTSTTSTTGPPTTQPPEEDERSSCGGLVWAAVAALVAGLLLLAFHLCPIPNPASVYLNIAGWALLGLYAILMGVFWFLDWLGICDTDICEAWRIHLKAFVILGATFAFFGFLASSCFWAPAAYILSGIAAAWSAIAIANGCRAT